jgi:hypothetical protein
MGRPNGLWPLGFGMHISRLFSKGLPSWRLYQRFSFSRDDFWFYVHVFCAFWPMGGRDATFNDIVYFISWPLPLISTRGCENIRTYGIALQ